MFARRIAAALTLLIGAGVATAQSGPQLLTVFPPGAKAGETVEVTFSGSNFTGEEKLLFSTSGFTAVPVGTSTVDPKAAKNQPAAVVKFKVTAPKETGTHDVRIVTKSGLSNPRAFTVGDLAEVNETEPNNDVGQAQKIALETTVNGTISTPTDVDYVGFKAGAGQNITVYCLTSCIDSRLSADIMVSTPDGKPLVANRGYRGGDAVLDFKAPSDGEYLVRVSQFAYTTGGADHFYRLTVTTKDWVEAVTPPLEGAGPITAIMKNGNPVKLTIPSRSEPTRLGPNGYYPPTSGMIDAVDPPIATPGGNPLLIALPAVERDNEKNNTADAAQPIKVPCDVVGRIGKKNDRHWYTFEAVKGEPWTIEVFAERIGAQGDFFFVLTDEKGKVIVEQDDGLDTLSPNQFYTKTDDPGRYRFSPPADGKYRVMVSSREASIQYGTREQFVLRVAKEKPEFRLAVMPVTPHIPDAATVARNSAVLFNVFVFRMDGFNDAITLEAKNLPPGVSCPPQVVAAGQNRGTLVLTADPSAKDWEGFVTITGTANKLTTVARPFTVVWTPLGLQANQPPPNSPMLTRLDRGPGLALAVRDTAPFSLTVVEKELKVRPGEKLEVTVKATRDEKFKDAIQVFSAVPTFGPRPQNNQPAPAAGTIAADKGEIKLSLDVSQNLPPGTYSLVLRGQPGAAPPKGGNNPPRIVPTYPTIPVSVIVEAPKKK